jgi:hypothetical protein
MPAMNKPWNNEARNHPGVKAAFVDVTVDQIKKGWTDRGIKRTLAEGGFFKKDDPRAQAIIDEARLQSRIPDPDDPNPATAPILLEHYENFDTSVSKNWIIKNVIAEGETSSWIGPPGAGKSALVTDLAIHIASSKDWRGHRSKQQCGVVYLALERGELVKRRLIAHARQTLGFPVKLPFSIARHVIDLVKPTCVGEIIATINDATEHNGCKTGVVIIDTYAKGIAAGGGDENSAKAEHDACQPAARARGDRRAHRHRRAHRQGRGQRGARLECLRR